MEIDQNRTQNSAETAPEGNNTTGKLVEWLDFSMEFPVGVFFLESLTGVVHINPRMRDHLKLEQMQISPVLEEYFWSRLESMAEDQEQARDLVRGLRNRILEEPYAEIRFGTGENHYLQIKLFKIDLEVSNIQSYAGIALELVDGRAAYRRQIKMLEEVSVQARKTSASAGGNLNALAGNLQAWSSEVLEEFLIDARDQQNQVNQSLDLMLNLIRTFEPIPIFSDTVNIIELLKEIITNVDQIEIRLSEGQDQFSQPPILSVDPALTRLALEHLVNEIIINNPEGQPVDVSVAIEENDLNIRLECPRTLPLPGLSSDQDEIEVTAQNIRMYLAKKIIGAQGGSIKLLRTGPGSDSVSSIEISLPTTNASQPIRRHGKKEYEQGPAEGRVLLAEAQPEYQVRLRDALQTAGYRVDLALDGSTALDMAQTINPDLVILARNLPGLDGLLVTQGIRRWSAMPIIMLSERANPDDLLYAYQLGVDDYLRKPFSIQEILVRAKVCLRRSENSRRPLTPDLFQSNLMRIDYSTRQVWIRGKTVELTPIEYNLLAFMSRQGKQIMPYEQLLESVWEGPEKGTRQGLFVHVKRLRKKIELDPKNPQIISNIWGVGYVFNP